MADKEMWWPSQQSVFNVPAAFSPVLAAQQAQWWYQQALQQQQQQSALPLPLVARGVDRLASCGQMIYGRFSSVGDGRGGRLGHWAAATPPVARGRHDTWANWLTEGQAAAAPLYAGSTQILGAGPVRPPCHRHAPVLAHQNTGLTPFYNIPHFGPG
ncbi:hypothetical protein J6590_063652 [Homalodisca vitripennis]|nr:hypothetical protein J6590_063652 [Homalodisca vitripennis]